MKLNDRRQLRNAHHIVILTGAGVSAESGVPTFRDKETGLWEKYDATQLATPWAFREDPALVWGWYEWRRMLILRAKPNPAHAAIAAIVDCVPEVTLITQNIDDLHERAGSHAVVHLHGSLLHPYCERCRSPYAHPSEIPDLPAGGARVDPPHWEACGGRVRPGIVWFGESLPELEWVAAREAVDRCDALLSVGTSSQVQPAASLIERAARRGAVTVQINPNSTELDTAFSVRLQGPAGTILPQLVKEVWSVRVESVSGS